MLDFVQFLFAEVMYMIMYWFPHLKLYVLGIECKQINVLGELEEHVQGSAIGCTLQWIIKKSYWM